MEEAGKEEYENAITNNMVHTDGIPWIKVYLDGVWSHRSYGHNCNAASRVASTQARYCFLEYATSTVVCVQEQQRKGRNPMSTFASKSGVALQVLWRPTLLLKDFEMHGVKYLEFIADGDSRVYSKIHQSVSYGHEVRKVSCKNHVIKNYGSALYKLKSDTTIAAAGRKYLTATSIPGLQQIATKVLYINAHGDVENLKIDLENGPYHVFGNHRKCMIPSYCNHVGESSDKIVQMELVGILYHIKTALQRIVTSQGHKLIDNGTNNRAELFMSLLCKFNAGKRLNTIQNGSLQTRACLSGLRYNKGADWQGSTRMETRSTTPGVPFQSFLNKCKTREECRPSRSSH